MITDEKENPAGSLEQTSKELEEGVQDVDEFE